MNYAHFVDRKLRTVAPAGIEIPDAWRAECLFPFQSDLVRWALRRGRAAIFADTGLGKSRMQLTWAHVVTQRAGCDALILAPLAVAAQTQREGAAIGVPVTLCREAGDVRPGINITNYDRLHRFDPSRFGAVVLDESSIIKHHNAKTLALLLDAFRATPYRLCATATPAPNDWTELGTHAEFLGVCTRTEMMSEYFVHDGGDTQVWRLKGHARTAFWRWVASWGALIRKPSDLGYDDHAYDLPPLRVTQHTVEAHAQTAGMLFAMEAQTLMERSDARRASMDERVEHCVSIVYDDWHKLAAEQQGAANGLETGIRKSTQGKRGCESEASREAPAVCKGQPATQQGDPEGVHEGVLLGEPGKVQANNERTARTEKCRSTQGVCGERGGSRCDESCSQSVAGGEPVQTKGAAPASIWDRGFGLRGHDGDAERAVRDLRVFGHRQQEAVSGSGSLPQNRDSARTSLHGVQSRARKVQGQRELVDGCRSVPIEAWLIWCDLNDEQDALERAFGSLAFSVRGSMSPDEKEIAIIGWLSGERPVMISKPSIMGWGINAQHCARMAFVGVTDSFEAYYQALRRCWRFGQTREVAVHIFASDLEGSVIANLGRKERDALAMSDAMSAETHDAVMAAVRGTQRQSNPYHPTQRLALPDFMRAA